MRRSIFQVGQDRYEKLRTDCFDVQRDFLDDGNVTMRTGDIPIRLRRGFLLSKRQSVFERSAERDHLRLHAPAKFIQLACRFQ